MVREGAREHDVMCWRMQGRGKGRGERPREGNVIHERNIVVTNVQRRMEGRVEMREGGGME